MVWMSAPVDIKMRAQGSKTSNLQPYYTGVGRRSPQSPSTCMGCAIYGLLELDTYQNQFITPTGTIESFILPIFFDPPDGNYKR
jgi:hypothetical protein